MNKSEKNGKTDISEAKRYKTVLAVKFRNINLTLVAFILLIFALLNYFMIASFVREASIDNVEFLTMESVDILNAHLSKEIALVKDAANSPEIIEWFADKDNPNKKTAAYNKLMLFAELLQMQKVYFAIAEHSDYCDGQNHTASGCAGVEYIVNAGAPFDAFVPYDEDGDAVLSLDNPNDGWFFDILDSDFDYILKLDTSNTFSEHQIFIDIKVKKDEIIVGTFSAALEFADIHRELFANYDSDIVIGLIIDNKGVIQLDSTKPEALSLFGESSVYNADEMFHIKDFRTDKQFLNAIDTYLNDMTLFSGERLQPYIIRLSEGAYEYMSIAPIPNTNWLKITFYDSTALFDLRRIIPLIAVVVSAFAAYVIIISVVIQRLVFSPLRNLAASVSRSEHNVDEVYGLDRNDEIGELANSLRDAWSRLSDNNTRLLHSIDERERQAKALHTLNDIAATLFGAEDEKAFEQALPNSLEMLRQCMDLQRISIWRNEVIDGELSMVMLYSLINQDGSKTNPFTEGQHYTYSTQAPLLLKKLSNGEFIYHSMDTAPDPDFAVLCQHALKRVLFLPILLAGDFWGFVRLDDDSDKYVLSAEDIEILHSGCLIIGSAINRNSQTAELRRSNAISHEMLTQIKRRDTLLQSVNQAAAVLLDTDIEEFEKTLHKGMRMMTKAVDADRVYISRNLIIDGKPCTTQIYEWASERAPAIGEELTNNISFEECLPDWYEKLRAGECVNEMAKEMAPATRKFMESSYIKSAFAAPIFVRDEFWGFAGFDDCTHERVFSDIEEAILRSSCLMIGNAFLRHEMTRELQNNISQLKALQEKLEIALEEANAGSRAKSVFLANMSHEIRTPMNSIIGFTELAADDDLPEKTKEYLSKILTNSEWLLQIINDVLDISKIESGKMEMESIPFDLHEMFAACRAAILPKVVEKGLTMHFYAEPSVGKRLYGDPTRLRQVFLNLLSNAVKFTNSGMIKMLASVNEIGADYVEMYFEVKDSGIGIPADQIEKVFDPFTQAESGTTRKYGGSGLGLPITKSIVEMMGGELSVESVPGIGTKFSFTLRFAAKDDNTQDSQNVPALYDNVEKPSLKGEILLCEDNMMNQQVICEHLSRVGLTTVIAENGEIGVNLIKERADKGIKQFDLVLMDIHMPVMDGIEAAKRILEMNVSVPVVAMTANIMKNDRDIYTAHGMKDCVGKPFTSQELWRCLLKYFTPVSDEEQKEDHFERDLRNKLIKLFTEDHATSFEQFTEALNNGELSAAYRIAHNLKTNAAQLHLTHLMNIAAEIDAILKKGEANITEAQLNTLEVELKAALAELTQQSSDY